MADILIRGMEMPNNVFDCPLNSFGICNLAQDETHCDCIGDSRPEWCPLVPLPEGHGRLIDGTGLYTILDGGFDVDLDDLPETKEALLTMIQSAETIVPEEGWDE